MKRTIRIALLIATWWCVAGAYSPARADGGMKESLRTVGHGFRDGAKAVGHGVRDGSRDVGHGFKDAVNGGGSGTRSPRAGGGAKQGRHARKAGPAPASGAAKKR